MLMLCVVIILSLMTDACTRRLMANLVTLTKPLRRINLHMTTSSWTRKTLRILIQIVIPVKILVYLAFLCGRISMLELAMHIVC